MADTPKPMQGTWTLTAPDGRTWQAESPLRVVAAESRERIPATVALERIYAAASEDHDWLPIHEAPKDGTRVILSWGGKSINGFYLDNSKTATPWSGWRVESMVPQPAGQPTHYQPFPAPKDYAVERKASEVEAARASLPAPTEDDWLKEAERLANRLVNRAALESSYSGGPLASKYRGERQAAQSLLMLHLRARPAEPTPDLYAAIMNLPQRPPDSAPPDWSWHDGYKIGHRDARHAAAELVAAAEPTPSASQETAMDSKPAAWMSREDFERLQADRWGIATATAYEQKSAAIPLFAAPPSDAAMTAESDTALLRQCLEALTELVDCCGINPATTGDDLPFGELMAHLDAHRARVNTAWLAVDAAIAAARQALEKP